MLANSLVAQYQHKGAVLDACFIDPSHCISGGLDGALHVYDQRTTVVFGCVAIFCLLQLGFSCVIIGVSL